ncbi:MAG: hypothetical protein JXA68_06990 [Ignavibacteriales bacterium]|nr:hypothetical protein [Ignavibacteriales bacterium]
MKILQKILFVCLFLFCVVNTTAQDDFDVKISESEVNNLIDAIIGARGFNFGDYSGGLGLAYWIANINDANINILPNNKIELNVTNMYFIINIDLALLEFDVTEHISGTFNGELLVQGDENNGFKIIIRINSIDNLSSWGDLGNLIGVYSDLFSTKEILKYFSDIPVSLTDIIPGFITNVFDYGTPLLSSDDNNIYLNFNVKGDRFVTIRNELKIPNGQSVFSEGDIYHLESSNFIPYPSGFIFAWDKNSQHTFKSEENGIDYESNHYKFFRWENLSMDILREYTASWDNIFTAELYNSFIVNFGMTYEGIAGNFGNINISGTDYTFPKSDYIIAAPLGEQVTASSNINYDNRKYVFINWSDGNLDYSRNISPTTSQNFTANYKGLTLTTNINAFSTNGQCKVVKTCSTATYPNGILCKVYDSMDKIWLETSTDNGATWEVRKNFIADSAKYPSITSTFENSVAIVFQQGVGDYSQIKFVNYKLDIDEITQDEYIVGLDAPLSECAYPLVSFSLGKIIVIWLDKYSTELMGPKGLYCKLGAYHPETGFTFSFEEDKHHIKDESEIWVTDENSINPTIIGNIFSTEGGFHLAWEQNGSIEYVKIMPEYVGYTLSDYCTVSEGNYTNNRAPSIDLLYGSIIRPIITWTADNLSQTDSYALVRIKNDNTVWGSINQFGNNVGYTNVSAPAQIGNNAVIVWSENNGQQAKYLNLVNGAFSSIGSIGDNSNIVHLTKVTGNTQSVSEIMPYVVLSNSYPYEIKESNYFTGIPTSVTANLTVPAGVHEINANVTVQNGATLTLSPGATLKFAENINLTVNSGGKLIANGTLENPIRFERKNTQSRWGNVNLYSNDNQLSYCVIDGGNYNVYIRGNNNTLSHCTSQNGNYGMVTYLQLSGGQWSSFNADNCLFQNNYIGISARYTYGGITNCEIKNNTGHGLYSNNCYIGKNDGSYPRLFRNNYIHNNSFQGLYLDVNAKIWFGYGALGGNNKIINNGSHEIYLQSTSYLLQSSLSEEGSIGGAYSDIYDNSLGYYIYNVAQTYDGEQYVAITQLAENNYWGPGGPSAGRFYGPVDYTPHWIYPTSPDAGGNQFPMQLEGEGETPVLKQLVTAGMTERLMSKNGTPDSSKYSVKTLVDIYQLMLDLRHEIVSNPKSERNAARLAELYRLYVAYDFNDQLQEKKNIKKLLNEKKDGYKNLKDKKENTNKHIWLVGESSMLIEIADEMNNGNYSAALSRIEEFDGFIKNRDNRRELLMQKLTALESIGKYTDALDVLEELKKEAAIPAEDKLIYYPPDYNIIEENLCLMLGKPFRPQKIQMIAKEQSPETTGEENKVLTFALQQNYPNPFNPTTTLRFSVPVPSKVFIEIYDIRGELIAILADRQYSAGEYNLQFDGSKLASGLYICRALLTNIEDQNDVHLFIQKMMLLK